MKEHGDVVVDQEVAGVSEHGDDRAAGVADVEGPLVGSPPGAFLGSVHLRCVLLERSGPDGDDDVLGEVDNTVTEADIVAAMVGLLEPTPPSMTWYRVTSSFPVCGKRPRNSWK